MELVASYKYGALLLTKTIQDCGIDKQLKTSLSVGYVLKSTQLLNDMQRHCNETSHIITKPSFFFYISMFPQRKSPNYKPICVVSLPTMPKSKSFGVSFRQYVVGYMDGIFTNM